MFRSFAGLAGLVALSFAKTTLAQSQPSPLPIIPSITPPCTPAQPTGSGLRACAGATGFYTGTGSTLPPSLISATHTQMANYVETLYKANPPAGIPFPVGPTFCDVAPTSFFGPEVTTSHDGVSCGQSQTLS